MFCTRLANGGLFPTGDPIVPFVISPRFECLNKRTHTRRINAGVLQGSVLGPSLFLLFMNDLPDSVSSQLAMSAISCAQASTVLNLDLECAINWADWLVNFNQKNTQLLSLSRSRSPHLSTLAINSIPLQELADIRRIGLDLTSNLSWDKYIRSIAKRASQRV